MRPLALSLLDMLTERTLRVEGEYKKHEDGLVMTTEQAATMSEALGLEKGITYRPYCLACDLMPRVALKPFGFECWHCGNKFGFDLKPL
jgi:hypothetical protein